MVSIWTNVEFCRLVVLCVTKIIVFMDRQCLQKWFAKAMNEPGFCEDGSLCVCEKPRYHLDAPMETDKGICETYFLTLYTKQS